MNKDEKQNGKKLEVLVQHTKETIMKKGKAGGWVSEEDSPSRASRKKQCSVPLIP
jgi:hypothetical protein